MWELVIISLLTVAVFFFIMQKGEIINWNVLILLSSSMGAAADIIRHHYLTDEVNVGSGLISLVFVICSFVLLHIGAYSFLMLVLSFYRMSWLRRMILGFLAFVPVCYDYLQTSFLPRYEIHYGFVFYFFLTCILTGTVLILVKYQRTPPSIERNQYFKMLLIYCQPPWMLILTFILPNYIYGQGHEFIYYMIVMQISVSISFILLLYYIVSSSGFLGVRILYFFRSLGSRNRIVTSGLDIINHSLKNDTNKILFVLNEIKANEFKPDEYEKYMMLIGQSAQSMSAMIERLHNKTKDITINIGVHKIQELIDNVVEKSNISIQNKQILFELDCSYRGTVQCDLNLLADDLFNIIENAIYAVAKQSAPLIRMTIGTYRKYVYISIVDNGIGISKRNQGRLFEPYFTTKNKSTNFGIGLYACHNNVTAQHGSVSVESEEGKGTEVRIYIPKGTAYDSHHPRGRRRGLEVSDSQ